MRQWLQKMMYKFSVFMRGRYGLDEFGRFLIYTALVLTILSYLPFLRVLSLVSLFFFCYYLFRVFSKDHTARRNELTKYFVWSDKFKKSVRISKAKWRDRKTHRYYKCKNCGALMRVPKNKGEIEITCPRCRARTTKKT